MNADDCITRVENFDLKCGFIRNIIVDGLYAESCHSFLRMLSVDSEIKNISVNNINGGFAAMAVNMDAARYCRTPLINQNQPRFINGVGCAENILISNMNVYAISKNPDRAFICLESNMNNFKIKNFTRNTDNDAVDSGYSIRIRNIAESDIITEGLTFEQTESITGNGIANKQSSPGNLAIYRIKIKNNTGDVFSLPAGSFSQLEINKAGRF